MHLIPVKNPLEIFLLYILEGINTMKGVFENMEQKVAQRGNESAINNYKKCFDRLGNCRADAKIIRRENSAH